MESVLVLNVDFSPLQVISWSVAMEKLVLGKVEVLVEYAGRVIRSAHQTFPFPAVVRLTGKFVKRRVRLSRSHVLARDAYTCCYCGARPRRPGGAPRLDELTLDHVVPRAQAREGWVVLPWSRERVRVSSWENFLTACKTCNADKADRTPAEARMTMRKIPTAPTPAELAWMSIFQYKIPEEWTFYLPEDSPWKGYWDAELVD